MRPAALLVVLATAFLVACGGSKAEPSPTPITDPGAAVTQAANATAQLKSFHMTITYSPIGAPIVFTVDYQDGNYSEHVPDPETGTSSDYIFHDNNTYRRDCSPQGVCGAWRSEPGRLVIPSLNGKVNSVPETIAPYIARAAKSLTLADQATMKLSGMVDLQAATKENQYQAFIAAGNSPADATSAVQQLWASQPKQADSAVDIWLTPDARYIAALTVYVPTQSYDPYLEITYSQHNAVTVKPPEGFS